MNDGPIHRPEFEGFVRRHESDAYAHSAMRHDLRNELLRAGLQMDQRLGSVERWQQRVIGALAMLTFLVTVAVGAGVIELLHR